MALDLISGFNPSALRVPPASAAVVVPSDTKDLPAVASQLYVGGTGNVRLTMVGGQDVLLSAVPAGVCPIPHGMRFTRVWSTNTTATLMVAFFQGLLANGLDFGSPFDSQYLALAGGNVF